MAYGDIKRLTAAGAQVAATTAAVYTAPAGTRAELGTILLHNSSSSSEDVEIYLYGSATASRLLNITLDANETYEFSPKFPIVLSGADTIQAKASNASEINVRVFGREETGVVIDSYWSNVELMLKADGTNDSTTFIDSSTNAFSITATGNAKISTAVSKYGGSSAYFDGTGDYLSIASPTADITNWYSSDFTLEAWVYLLGNPTNTANGNGSLCGNASPTTETEYWCFGPMSDRKVRFAYYKTPPEFPGPNLTTTTVLNLNQWYHIAFTKASTTLRIWIDGVQSAEATVIDSPQNSTGTNFVIGQVSNGNFNGYVDDFRITKGIARYTATFTPPLSAPTL